MEDTGEFDTGPQAGDFVVPTSGWYQIGGGPPRLLTDAQAAEVGNSAPAALVADERSPFADALRAWVEASAPGVVVESIDIPPAADGRAVITITCTADVQRFERAHGLGGGVND